MALLGCSKQEENEGSTMTSGEPEPYKLTITNGCRDAQLSLKGGETLEYNETSDIFETYKDTAYIAFRWSDKEYVWGDPDSFDTAIVVMKTKKEVFNFRINR